MKRSADEKGRRIGLEEIAFGCAGLTMLAAAGAAVMVRRRVQQGELSGLNPRMQYGFEHLPGALIAALLFLALVAMTRGWLVRERRWSELPVWYFAAAVGGCFCLFWLPAVLAGGFDKDDWMLLGAASVRKILAGRPWLAWDALDSVDGNFRPLGTVLYIGVMLRHFGVWARPFLLGLFAVNLLGSLTAFAVARALRYSRVAAAAGAMLYSSRSEIYPIVTWTCALGDALVILLCGLMVPALLVAIRRRGWTAAALHVAAWGCFCLATLAKQSAFAAPLLVGLVLWLRPGTTGTLPLARRLRAAALGVAVYGATATVPFFHAKRLLAGPPPYPLGFSFDALLRVFGYATWYVGSFEFPVKYAGLQTLPNWLGIAVACGVLAAIRRVPRLLGERPRDVVFCLLAGVASVSLFAVLPARVAPYYGSMAAFWVSIGLGIALTRFGWASAENRAGRVCCFVFSAMVAGGFLDVRLKQTGLISSGGYTWGASEVGQAQTIYNGIADGIARELSREPGTEVLVLEDMPNYDGYFAGMAMTADPGLKRILTYRTATGRYLVNDRAGELPADDLAGLRDPRAYNWNVTMEGAEAERLSASERVLRLKFHGGKIERAN